MKVYDAYPHGVLHLTKFGFIRFTNSQREISLPKNDERIFSIQPVLSDNVDIHIATKKHKSFYANFRSLARDPRTMAGWVRLVPLTAGDEVESAGSVGDVGGRDATYLAPLDQTAEEDGSAIVLEHVGSQVDVKKQYGIRVLRYPKPVEIPVADVSMLEEDVRKRFPEPVFSEPGIVVLHAQLMKRALAADHRTIAQIADETGLAKSEVTAFVNCTFESAKTPQCFAFVKWLIEHGYSFNQIVQRSDKDALLTGNGETHSHHHETNESSEEERVKQYSKADRTEIRHRAMLYMTTHHLSVRAMAAEISMTRDTLSRILDFREVDVPKPKHWKKLEDFLRRK